MNRKFNLSLGDIHFDKNGLDIKDSNLNYETDCSEAENIKMIETLNRVLPNIGEFANKFTNAISNRTNPQLNEIVERLNNASMAFTQQDQRIGNVEAELGNIIKYLQSQAQPAPQQPTQPAQPEAVNADLMKVVSDLIKKASEEKSATTKTTPKK